MCKFFLFLFIYIDFNDFSDARSIDDCWNSNVNIFMTIFSI